MNCTLNEHAQTYATEFTNRLVNGPIKIIDGVEEEKAMISKGEKEIIGRLNCPVKFTRHNFSLEVKLGVGVNSEKKEFVRREKEVTLDFLGSRDWFLEPAIANAMYSSKESTVHLLDAEQKRKIMAKCPTISGTDAGDVYMMSVHERISIPTDLRHLMMKMYLILQDYNLGVTSKSSTVEHLPNIKYNTLANAQGIDRLAAVSNHRIVIDSDNFTPSELGLLGLAGESYPSVWYGLDNMYTKCNMDNDDVILISDGEIDIDDSMVWGSPDRLYQMIWTIAAKLNAIPSLISAFENMRGKVKLAADLVKRVNSNRICSMVPLSYCMENAFGNDISKYSVTNSPGFLSSSMSLVSDLLYGMTFEAAASCVCESLGAIGTLVSSKTPSTNQVINGIFRDYGLQHSSSEDNILLRNWDIMHGRPMTWDFGPCLKDYLIKISESISNGLDISLPQILHAIPSLTAVNTAYGISRGWRGPKNVLDSNKLLRSDDADGLASFCWLMGEREVRPKVFFNKSSKKPIQLGQREYQLQSEVKDGFGIGEVTFWLYDTLGGRVDENEETATSLYRTEYAGTKCSIVFNYSNDRWVFASKQDPPGRQSMKGDIPPSGQEIELEEKGLDPKLSGINWGAGKKDRTSQLFDSLATLSRGNKIVVSNKPRHMRIGSRGVANVDPYTKDGNEETELITNKKQNLSEGDEINFSRIDVPGDGQCGIHAMVEDLKTHGLIASGDVTRTQAYFSGEMASKTFHDANEMAAVAQTIGMNLDLYDRDTSRLVRYGTNPQGHTFTIFKEGPHFTTGKIGDGPNKFTIRKLEEQEKPSDEFIADVQKYGQLFALGQ